MSQVTKIPAAELTDGLTAASFGFNRTNEDISNVALRLEEPITSERATKIEKTTRRERAMEIEKTKMYERSTKTKTPRPQDRANGEEKTMWSERLYTFEDILAVRMLVRAREDFQSLRKKMDNRLGRKADGTDQNIDERAFRLDDVEMFKNVADAAHDQ